MSRLEITAQNLKCDKSSAALDKLKGAAQAYNFLEKAKLESKQMNEAQSNFKIGNFETQARKGIVYFMC